MEEAEGGWQERRRLTKMMIRKRTKSVTIMKRKRLGTATTLIRQGGSRDDDKDGKGEKDEERPFVTMTVNEGDLG